MNTQKQIEHVTRLIELAKKDAENATDLVKHREKELKALQAQLEREKTKRDTLPPGFTFQYNNRRGDPQYTPFWEMWIRNAQQEEVARYTYSEEHYTEKEAFAAALDTAWKLTDIADAIMHARQMEPESHGD